jgi:hypothetical protein
MRETGSANQPYLLHDLYQAAVKDEGQPLTSTAAQALKRNISPNDNVLIVTGAGVPPWLPYGETDGPPGAIGLAHGLARAIGARPILAIEERSKQPLIGTAQACGLVNVPYDTLKNRNTAVSIISHPEGPEEGESFAENAIEKYDPAAIIAVEKLGTNRNGEYPQGKHYLNKHAFAPPLFDLAKDNDILTVGVGDRGNEIGFGKIEKEVRNIREADPEMACDIATDYLVVGGASNWGAYGIEAMLALLTDTPEAMHAPKDEIRMLEYCSR